MSDNASTLAECLVVLKARLSDHLSPAENREIDEAIRFVCGYDSCAPKGWKLVPLQPTAEMLKAGAYSTISSDSRTAIYAAMLAVAPDAPFDEIPQGWGDVRSENVDRVLKAIDDEPELPGEMPGEMLATLIQAVQSHDHDLLTETLRIVVRQTKEGIRERYLASVTRR